MRCPNLSALVLESSLAVLCSCAAGQPQTRVPVATANEQAVRGERGDACSAEVVVTWRSREDGGGEHSGPIRVDGNSDWTNIAVGREHACAIRAGQLYCWGANWTGNFGQVAQRAPGRTDSKWIESPLRVGEQDGWEAIAISRDSRETCGIRAGELYCWSLPIRTPAVSPEARRVSTDRDWTAVDPGLLYTCGLRRGQLFCWERFNGIPVRAGNADDWTAVSVGSPRRCAIRQHDLHCWTNATKGGAAVVPGAASTLVSAGGWRVFERGKCGIRNGKLLCFAASLHGERGLFRDSQQTGLVATSGDDWEAVAVGDEHTCGIRQGRPYCWGRDEHGELGGGTVLELEGRVRVSEETGWQSVATGGRRTCAIRCGELYCWGEPWSIGPADSDVQSSQQPPDTKPSRSPSQVAGGTGD